MNEQANEKMNRGTKERMNEDMKKQIKDWLNERWHEWMNEGMYERTKNEWRITKNRLRMNGKWKSYGRKMGKKCIKNGQQMDKNERT